MSEFNTRLASEWLASELPNASTTEAGRVELANEAEAITGTDDTRAMTPLRTRQAAQYETPYTYGGVGDGSADDTAAIQAAIDAALGSGGRGKVRIPRGSWKITEPIIMPERVNIVGDGPRIDGYSGTVIIADSGFSGLAMFVTSSWSLTASDWWHWASLEDMTIDGNDVADGVAVYQAGEVSSLKRLTLRRMAETGIIATGAHAPLLIDSCQSWGDYDTMIHLTSHPSLAGNSGAVHIRDCSGDGHTVAFVRISGSHAVTVTNPKTEVHPNAVIVIDGATTGGDSPALTVVGGYSNEASGLDELVRIDDTAQPSIVLMNWQYNFVSGAVVIRDNARSRTLAMGTTTSLRNTFITWGALADNHIDRGFIVGGDVQFQRWETNTVGLGSGDMFWVDGDWEAPLRLGSYCLWVDGDGKLRIKSGMPSSATDGTVVGAQTT